MNRQANYDKSPFIEIRGLQNCVWEGYPSILQEIHQRILSFPKEKIVIALDCYPGVFEDEILSEFMDGLNPDFVFQTREISKTPSQIEDMLAYHLTDDRVFGRMSCHGMQDFFDEAKLRQVKKTVAEIDKGIIFLYGTGASLLGPADILIYADLARWEIQRRYREQLIGNWCAENITEEPLKKYKRGFFVDWRVADRHKQELFSKMSYLLDTNLSNTPKLLTAQALFSGLRQAVSQPFRVVPFFDAGVWGGQWMKDVCGLDRKIEKYAWCFDCVPEENSLYLMADNIRVEIPSINLVFFETDALLGPVNHARFGKEFPIRFDFLDTMQGGNLSLQVHPLTEYIQNTFGMHYTQDESYYLLDAQEDAVVYLGLRQGIHREEMLSDLYLAQTGNQLFDVDKYINKYPAKKHDHFLIPAGTIHCSGCNAMVLEISSTPFIFTFKLWDWGRVGLDGLPRPIHLEHGEKVIQWNRDTEWVEENLMNQVELLYEDDFVRAERTGLHPYEFIETRRYWAEGKIELHTGGGVQVLNLVEGDEAVVESPEHKFEPFIVHYVETFIIPAAVGAYTIRPSGKTKKIAVLQAFVRK